MRQFWTDAEIAEFRQMYRQQSAPQIARHFGRTPSAVYQLAHRLGLMAARKIVSDKTIEDAVNQLNPKGIGDTEIAKVLSRRHGCGVDRHRVSSIRKRLGLPLQAYSDRQRSRAANKTRKQLGLAGLKSLAELRLESWAKWKRSLGWPEHLTIRAVQAAEIFWQMRGLPLTRLQLCQLMGVESKKRTAPISNHPSGTVLGELVAEGIIVRIPKGLPVVGQGKGRSKDVYILREGVKPSGNRTEIAASQTVRGDERGPAFVASTAAGSVHQQHQPRRHAANRRQTTGKGKGRRCQSG